MKSSFPFLLLLVGVAALGLPLPSSARAAETATYRGLQTDEFLKRWLVLAPVPVFAGEPEPDDEAAQKQAFATDHLAEQGGEAGVEPVIGAGLQIAGRDRTWRLVQSESNSISLIQPGQTNDYAIAYAWAEIEMPEAKTLAFGFGSDDAIKVWLNGRLVHDHWAMRPLTPDEDLVRLDLVQGTNRVLLKILNGAAEWGFTCRPLSPDTLSGLLVRAAERSDLDGLKLALASGADINTRWLSLTALQVARIAGDEEVAGFLIEQGADTNAPMPAPEAVINARLSAATRGESSGVAVLVARDGQILFEQGWGYASIEHAVPFTPQTRSRIGSVTKQFTAAAILRLAEQGKLTLQDKLRQYYPDFPRGDEVTLHHLLTHTSGIHSYTSKPDFLGTVTVDVKPEDHVRSFQNDPYDFSPGERWLYCNSGYFLLGCIVEKVAGCSYADFLRREFFVPLGMTNSGVHTATAILKHEATGYSYAGGQLSKAINWDMSRAGGAGALYSTVGDLFRWNEAVFSGQVLKEESLKAAFAPVTTQQDTEPADQKETGYGYGWAIGNTRGLRVIEHGGGLHGFLSYLLRFPEQKLTVAVLANVSDSPSALLPSAIASQVAQLYLWREMKPRERPQTTPLDPAALDAVVGRYDYGGPILVVTREGDRLFAQLTGQPRFEIFPKSADTFFWKVVEAEVQFVKDDKGEVVKGIHRQGGAVIQAPRLAEEKAMQLDASVLDAYVGKYDYRPGVLVLTVTREGDRLFAQMTGQPKFEIYPKSETEFFWKVVAARVTFVKDSNGKVTKAIGEQGGQTVEAPRIE